MDVRVGQGFDVHAFSDDAGRVLVLGGVEFDGERGLAGPQRRRRRRPRVRRRAARCGRAGRHRPALPRHRSRVCRTPTRSTCCETCVVGCGRRAGRSATSTARWCANAHVAPRRAEMESRLTEAVGAAVAVKASRRRSSERSVGAKASLSRRGGGDAMTPGKSRGPEEPPGPGPPASKGGRRGPPVVRPVASYGPARSRRIAVRDPHAGSVASRSRAPGGARAAPRRQPRVREVSSRPIRTTSSVAGHRRPGLGRGCAGPRDQPQAALRRRAHRGAPGRDRARRHPCRSTSSTT